MIRLVRHLVFVILLGYVELRILRVNDRVDCGYCEMRTRCFRKSDWCDIRRDCRDGIDEDFCDAVFPNCGSHHDSCSSGECIPKTWICDGQVDCSDGSDEDCVEREGRLKILSSARTKFRKWILSQRSTGWGWEKDTPRAIVAMYLMNTSEFSSGNLVSELAAKELEAHLSFAFFRNQTIPIGEGELALFLHAMLATCLDPTNFNGLNIISALEGRISKLEYVKPITLLALCNAGHPISQKYINKLKDIISKPNKSTWIDTKAIAAMALICAMRQANNQDLNTTVHSAIHELKGFQLADGSFGNTRTSAVIMQAIISNKDTSGCLILKALQYLANQHRNDSNGMLTNYLIMPLLSQRSLLNLGEVNCSHKNTNNLRNLTFRESLEQKLGRRIHVQYSVQIGDEKDISYSNIFRIPVNITFFDVMRLASEMDKRYAFQWGKHHEGKYIYSIRSIDNDPELQKYWTLYRTNDKGGADLINEDVDNIYPGELEHYIFWYKRIRE